MSSSKTPGRALPGEIDYDALSPSQIFKPRNPGVRRSPPPGSSLPLASSVASSSSPAAAPPPPPPPPQTLASVPAAASPARALPSPRTARSSPRTTRTPARATASPQASPARAGPSTTPRGVPSALQHQVPLDADTTVETSDMDIDPPSFAAAPEETLEEPVAAVEPTAAVVLSEVPVVDESRAVDAAEPAVEPQPIPEPVIAPAPPTTSAPAPAAVLEPKTPASKPSSKSKRKAADVFVDSVKPVAPEKKREEVGEYGKRYAITVDTLQLAAKAASTKWKAKDLQGCLPLLAAQHKQTMEHVWLNSSQSMQTAIIDKATFLFDHYRVGPALQDIDAVVSEARAYAAAHPDAPGRPDAWQPDLSPATLTVAANLPMYDEVYNRLRDEYLELHQKCSSRYKRILEKQEELRLLEGAVSDGVVELEQTIKILDGFPNEEMMAWTEKVAGQMDGRRG